MATALTMTDFNSYRPFTAVIAGVTVNRPAALAVVMLPTCLCPSATRGLQIFQGLHRSASTFMAFVTFMAFIAFMAFAARVVFIVFHPFNAHLGIYVVLIIAFTGMQKLHWNMTKLMMTRGPTNMTITRVHGAGEVLGLHRTRVGLNEPVWRR